MPRGSRLVYNTGRSLEKCLLLFEEKCDVLPPPDLLICSVGTKVRCHLLARRWALEPGLSRRAAQRTVAELGSQLAAAAGTMCGQSEKAPPPVAGVHL